MRYELADYEWTAIKPMLPNKKPAPDVYDEVLARLRVSASDCLAIEDSRNGLVAASMAGIPVIVTRSVYFSR